MIFPFILWFCQRKVMHGQPWKFLYLKLSFWEKEMNTLWIFLYTIRQIERTLTLWVLGDEHCIRFRNVSWEFLSLVECSLCTELMCILWVVECSSEKESINHSLGGRTIWNLGGNPSIEDQFKSRGSRNRSWWELTSQVERISLKKFSDRDSTTIAAN